jgi:hypothetical protein
LFIDIGPIGGVLAFFLGNVMAIRSDSSPEKERLQLETHNVRRQNPKFKIQLGRRVSLKLAGLGKQ